MIRLPRDSWRWIRLAPLAAVLAGCYTYVPVPAARTGADVRARLTTAAAIRRSEGLTDPIRGYSGEVVRLSVDSVTLDVVTGRSPSQFDNVVFRDSIAILRSDIAAVEERRLSKSRTALVLLAAVGAGALIANQLIESGGNIGDGGGGNPRAVVVPLVSLPIGGRMR